MKPQPRKARRSGSYWAGMRFVQHTSSTTHRRSTPVSCDRRKLLKFSGLTHADLDFTDPSLDNAKTDGTRRVGVSPSAGLVRSPAAARVRPTRTMPPEERIQKSVDS